MEKLGSTFEERVGCEAYRVDASLISEENNLKVNLKEANVYVPVDPAPIGKKFLLVGKR